MKREEWLKAQGHENKPSREEIKEKLARLGINLDDVQARLNKSSRKLAGDYEFVKEYLKSLSDEDNLDETLEC